LRLGFLKEANMREAARFSVCLFLALAALSQARLQAEDFQIEGRKLSGEECTKVRGGFTDIFVNEGRTRAFVTTIPEDRFGRDYARARCFTIEAQNNFQKTTYKDAKDCYDPVAFPKGTFNVTVAKIGDDYRSQRYGSSTGEWIKTDATTTVTSYPYTAAREPDKTKPIVRNDSGYNLHANNASPFETAKSLGCIILRKTGLDRLISTLKADLGKKKITVR
jgi:hypothetical protein